MKTLVVILCALVGFAQVVITDAVVDTDLVKIYFFYGPSYDDHAVYDLKDAYTVLAHPNFKLDLKTTLYIHGYYESAEVTSVRHTVEAYLTNGNYNILVLDWGAYSYGTYTTVVNDMNDVGERMITILLSLFDAGLSLEKFHLVGHSLGAQMAGVIGNGIQVVTDKDIVLPRITALDPAGPLFWCLGRFAMFNRPLQSQDAEFVDVIHTDAGVAGIDKRCGTVDFWPNSGKQTQPGCRFGGLGCSHQRSWRYWSESLLATSDPHTFIAIQADSYKNFQRGKVYVGPKVSMGINCPKVAIGSYYLDTASSFPYSLGLAGIRATKS